MYRVSILALAIVAGLSTGAYADTYVNGYYRQDGTYVEPHHRTNPDGNRFNNYSTQGNTNPYTGQAGTVNPYTNSNPYGGSSSYGSTYGSPRRW